MKYKYYLLFPTKRKKKRHWCCGRRGMKRVSVVRCKCVCRATVQSRSHPVCSLSPSSKSMKVLHAQSYADPESSTVAKSTHKNGK